MRKVAELRGHAFAVPTRAWAPAADQLVLRRHRRRMGQRHLAPPRDALCTAARPAQWRASSSSGRPTPAPGAAPPAPIAGHTDGVTSIAWAAGGDRIASEGHGQMLLVWCGGRARALTAAMALHPRLGAASQFPQLVHRLVASSRSWSIGWCGVCATCRAIGIRAGAPGGTREVKGGHPSPKAALAPRLVPNLRLITPPSPATILLLRSLFPSFPTLAPLERIRPPWAALFLDAREASLRPPHSNPLLFE